MEKLSVPDYYKPLSLRVCKILDNIGASEEIRKLTMETTITTEIVHSLASRDISRYIFGSAVEGTSTAGLNSNTDYVLCYANEVFQNLADLFILTEKEVNIIMVRDETTRPGYTKLQVIGDWVPLTRLQCSRIPERFAFDSNQRLVLKRHLYEDRDVKKNYRMHGPAGSIPPRERLADQDYVVAYKSRSWPEVASEWLIRPREYGWPTQDLIAEMKKLGFFVVPVGHPHSSERDIEWRISLSLQERMLMFSLNPTQYKCYILLKMVKKDIINNLIGEESISSYHFKTCLFYMIENTPGSLWQPKYLLTCLQGCLKCILTWVTNGNCSNYFISRENMFEGRITGDLRRKLQHGLEMLLTTDCNFLLSIKTDDLGQHITNAVFPGSFAPMSTHNAAQMRQILYVSLARTGPEVLNTILAKISSWSREDCIREIFQIISDLSHVETITEHTRDQTRKAACLFLPYLEMSLISHITINQVLQGETGKALDFLESLKWHELSVKTDCFSVKLKQATFMYMLGHHDESLEVLTSLENRYSELQISCCGCRVIPTSVTKMLLHIIEENNLSYDEFIHRYFVSCVIFLQSEKTLVPTALSYEMIRSVHMPFESWNIDNFSPDWAVVDGKVLLYFLLFLTHSRLNMEADMTYDIMKIEWVLLTDPNLSHTETTLNLIGWCYKQTGVVSMAILYFYASLALQRNHNAAFWHILVTLSELIQQIIKCT